MSNAELLEMICGSAGRSLAKQRLPEVFGICTPRQRSILAGEDREPYVVHPQIAAAKELYVRAIQEDMNASGVCLSSPNAVSSYLSGRIGNYEHEVFMCLWLDARNRLTQTSVYPREVVKRALFPNAAAVIFAHNHPSGDAEPSRSDEMLTNTLKTALALVDVRVLDHFVVAGNKTISFAERGVL